MNINAGSKKLINAVAAAGTVESRTIRTENMQNIPNNALGNLIAASTNTFFRNLSATTISPRDTTKWTNPNTEVEVEVVPVSVSEDLAATCRVLLRVPLVSVSERVVDERVRLGRGLLRVELGKSVRRRGEGVRVSLRSEKGKE